MNSTDLKPKEVAFWEGRPIEKFSEDQLGRKDFARFFSEAIARHNGRESLVLAVNAPWGEGKTSFKNMMTDLLAQEKADRVVILNFTPWEWASQNQVSEAFFSEIAKQLELKDKSENAKQAASRFRALGSYLGLAGQIITPAGPFLEGGLPGSTIVTFALGKGLSKAREVARSAADDLERAAEEAKKSLPSVKEDLRSALRGYLEKERKLILVVIDDIDRLSPEEIRLVFQMVRVNADFPAMVFLLLYDEDFVVTALQKYFGDASNRFLEKIVQFQTTLPVLVDNRLRDHVADELVKLFAPRPPYAALFDVERYRNLWAAGIGVYITNLRQCGRLLSSYEFHLGVFRSSEAEVNPLDFLVLEVFRLFEPQLHRNIYANGDRLFPGFSETVLWAMHQKQDKEDPWDQRVGEFLKNATKPAASSLVKELFSRHGFGADHFGVTIEGQEAARQRRLCHILYFNRYFRLTIDAGDIPDARVSELVNAIDEPTKLAALLKALAKEGNLALGLTKLLARGKLKPSSKPVESISALCDFGDEAAVVQRTSGLVEPLDALNELAELQLDPAMPSGDRTTRLLEGIRASRGVHLPVSLAKSQDYAEHAWSKANEYEKRNLGPHLDRSDVEKLNETAAERLEKAVHADALKLTPAWTRSIEWYLHFMRERVKKNPGILLAKPTGIALALTVVINDQSAEEFPKDRSVHFAQSPMFMAKHCFGFDNLDKAVDANEAELRNLNDSIAKRIVIYRDMRQHFSHLADPKPPAADSGNVEEV